MEKNNHKSMRFLLSQAIQRDKDQNDICTTSYRHSSASIEIGTVTLDRTKTHDDRRKETLGEKCDNNARHSQDVNTSKQC